MTIRCVLLDFGGTLDCPGVHWSTRFADAFLACGLQVDRPSLDRAFFESDRRLAALPQIARLDLLAHVRAQSRFILEELRLDPSRAAAIAWAFLESTSTHLARSRSALKHHASRFRFGLVSNFSPNLGLILRDAGLADLFSAVVVSSLAGHSKPELAIFERALRDLDGNASEAAMVGDSLRADIAPAKRLGLATVWVRGDESRDDGECAAADYVVKDVAEALAALAVVP